MLNNINSEKIKPTYSQEVIEILEDIQGEKLIKECHRLRKINGNLKQLSDEELIIYALQMYKRKKERISRNKLKREKNERTAN